MISGVLCSVSSQSITLIDQIINNVYRRKTSANCVRKRLFMLKILKMMRHGRSFSFKTSQAASFTEKLFFCLLFFFKRLICCYGSSIGLVSICVIERCSSPPQSYFPGNCMVWISLSPQWASCCSDYLLPFKKSTSDIDVAALTRRNSYFQMWPVMLIVENLCLDNSRKP